MIAQTDRRIREIGRRVSGALVESAGPGRGRTLIAGVSGGADSSAMLLLLSDTQARHGWRIRAAHVDHAIQSSAIRTAFRAAAERVAALADVRREIISADAPAERDAAADGIEAAARRVRYAALTRLARDRGAPVVAVAHTRDDQAETVLLHILRGSGLDGLSGMHPLRPLSDEVLLIRPLLDVTRMETEAVCRAYDWAPVHDPSNDDLRHTRNQIRRRLLPLMSEINPNISQRLAQQARSVRAERALLEEVGQQTLAALRDAQGRLPRRAVRQLSPQLQNRIIRALCRERGVTLSAERTAAALNAVRGGRGVVQLPGGVRLTVAQGVISVE